MQEVTIKEKSLMSSQKNYVEAIGKGLESLIGKMNSYQAVCGYNILNAINVALAKDGLTHQSPNIDKESVNDAIKLAVFYQLNTDNKEVFVIVRNEKRATGYIKKIECKPQYKGHLKILAEYGRNVKKVYPEWLVRDGDEFTYPTMKGIEQVPPTWTPKGYDGKVVRVIVPIQYNDGYVEYRIAERESVATNIKAQIKQSVMYDKDGDKILALITPMTLEQLLTEPNIRDYVNDTYTGLSSEEMIITKMILNAIKRVPIDFSNAMQRETLEKTYDNADVYKKNHTAAEIIDMSKSEIEMKEPVAEIEHNSQFEEANKFIDKAINPTIEEKEEVDNLAELMDEDVDLFDNDKD